MHSRPRFFAKVMGELMFWLGEDKLVFGADYAIWEPRWQVEGFVDWNMPTDAEFADYGQLSTQAKKKILGLNAARLYDIKVPAELDLPVPAGPEGAEPLAAPASI
jgi:predicted TIM-barrel fold metal-dependent hydrolase